MGGDGAPCSWDTKSANERHRRTRFFSRATPAVPPACRSSSPALSSRLVWAERGQVALTSPSPPLPPQIGFLQDRELPQRRHRTPLSEQWPRSGPASAVLAVAPEENVLIQSGVPTERPGRDRPGRPRGGGRPPVLISGPSNRGASSRVHPPTPDAGGRAALARSLRPTQAPPTRRSWRGGGQRSTTRNPPGAGGFPEDREGPSGASLPVGQVRPLPRL